MLRRDRARERSLEHRVREDQGLLRHGHRLAHAVVREVREVDHHPEPVHLPDHVPAEVGKSAVDRPLRLDVAQLLVSW